MTCRALLLALTLTTLLARPGAAARAVLLHPVDGAVTTAEWGPVTGFWDAPGADEITVVVNGQEHRVPLWDGVFQQDFDWLEGDNEVQVGDRVVRFVSDPYSETVREPAVHQAMLDNCGNCHRLGPELDLSRSAPDAELCGGCHDGAAHGATPCTGCHDPHVSWNPGLLRRTGNPLCLECHAGRTGEAGVAHHDLWGELHCTTCHPAHRPAPDAVGDRCRSCHQDRTAAAAAHRDAVATACDVCHTMHGAAAGDVWKPPEESCRTCHPAGPDTDHEQAVAECGACHAVHREQAPPPSGDRCRPCHGAITDKQRVHGPDALGQCEVCHPPHDIANRSPAVFSCTGCHGTDNLQGGHTGSVVGFDTCLQCHHLHRSDEPFFLPRHQHRPFAERACADCHDHPLLGTRRRLDAPWAELCGECHPRQAAPPGAHAPVAEGRCQACHVPHASPWPGQLRRAPAALCTGCHPQQAPGADPSPHQRELACDECHAPHGGPDPNLLTATGNQLCTGCHIDPTLDLGGVLKPYVHGPLNTVGCSFCHDPHGSAGGAQLRMAAEEVCVACHDEFAAADASRLHRPVAEGRCAACHQPHAAANRALVRSTGNALCRGCHDPARHSHTLVPRANSVFAAVPDGFPRDGEQLACTGCHRPHRSTEEGLFTAPRAELCQTCHQGI